ncbi:O-antigen ligase family protein [Alistipes sp.]|uniref:O-antigen ligase family protein n=1 Tax=Alistipes sp. TaxID=1872444 RepID=UPI003AEFC292
MSRRLKYLSLLVALIAINNIIAFSINLGALYYAIMGMVFFIALCQNSRISINIGVASLIIAAILSIVGNDIPVYFHPWARLATFVLMTVLLSPLIQSSFLNRLRIRVFQYVQWGMEPIVILSLLAYFAGLTFGRRDFAGITTQSMLIAPISANVIITSTYFLTNNSLLTRKKKYYHLLLMISAFITLLLAASRTAIIGAAAGLLVYFYIMNRANLFKFLKKTLYLVLLLCVTFPLWSSYVENLNRKNKSSIAEGSILSSREIHWQTRIREFTSSPLLGIGFASVSTGLDEGSTMDIESGQVETGSSWLSLLSMTGILGFMAFLLIFLNSFISLFRMGRINIRFASYLSALMIFWAFHMMAEGYIHGAGGFLFFNLWLLIGSISAFTQNKVLTLEPY